VILAPRDHRLGPADLETVDTLITAGVATSRAEAVRWALARMRRRLGAPAGVHAAVRA
jgi:Arc/MetJ-type ribon-helix-helix transcriptional regulator